MILQGSPQVHIPQVQLLLSTITGTDGATGSGLSADSAALRPRGMSDLRTRRPKRLLSPSNCVHPADAPYFLWSQLPARRLRLAAQSRLCGGAGRGRR